MNNKIILLSKDALLRSYLPIYGNKYWNTPNIDILAREGTVFYRHYTSAPSTAMAFTSMFTGKYPYQLNRKKYQKLKNEEKIDNLFEILRNNGYENHIVWSDNYMIKAMPYSRCFDSEHTVFHNIDINQPVGPHLKGLADLKRDENKVTRCLEKINSIIDDLSNKKKIFLWVHLPHVILGRISYGDDIDILDNIVGYIREKIPEADFYLTADHGHMNGRKAKYTYGFDVYEPAISIPLISTRIEKLSSVDYPTSNTFLLDIILEKKIPHNEYILSDTAYYGQIHRKTAIVSGDYKFIYTKYNNYKELYDLKWDENEDVNLLKKTEWDIDRKRKVVIPEIYFYPKWNSIDNELEKFNKILRSFWKKGNILEEIVSKIFYLPKKLVLMLYFKIYLHKKNNRK